MHQNVQLETQNFKNAFPRPFAQWKEDIPLRPLPIPHLHSIGASVLSRRSLWRLFPPPKNPGSAADINIKFCFARPSRATAGSRKQLSQPHSDSVFHLDISWGGGISPPEMTISPRRRRPENFFNFSSRLQAYERNRTGTVRSDFCLQIGVVLYRTNF